MVEQVNNFWEFLLVGFDWLGGRWTRILGIAQGTIAIIAAQDNLLTQKQVSFAIMVSGILTYWRGQSTATTVAQAKAVLAQNPTLPPSNSTQEMKR